MLKQRNEFIQDAVFKAATEIIARNPDYLKNSSDMYLDGLVKFFSKLYDRTEFLDIGSSQQQYDEHSYDQLSERIC
ncbi:MAG: hypothetical protein GY750_17190 [Lentisphaerae bacterium]|nr:hypothetical protein [Lentisphaerota bacterium]MCP4103133.1 hypothetical protein [Lentisphaerota bacterium]